MDNKSTKGSREIACIEKAIRELRGRTDEMNYDFTAAINCLEAALASRASEGD